MQIAAANIRMESYYHFHQEQLRQERWAVRAAPEALGVRDQPARPLEEAASSENTTAAMTPAPLPLHQAPESVPDEPIHDLRIELLRTLVERLIGRPIELFRPEQLRAQAEAEMAVPAGEAAPTVPQGASLQLVYQFSERRIEVEQSHFSARGTVHTTDGQAIDFTVDLTMSRSFVETRSLDLFVGGEAELVDPLVINFNGSAAQLTERHFHFDLDADGEENRIAFVQPGSGFLAVDWNGNGRIDDGRELFGAVTGDGFAELAVHDADGNGWIDAADPVYQHLRIWSLDANGERQLLTLGEAGVGAIYLGHVETPFDLRNGQNELLGRIRSTGLFVGDDGRAGTVQQVDLAV